MLPAATLPLLLHLWMSRRIRVVELSTFRFLFESYIRQRKRLKFREALVAALRTAFLFLLIMVVARPMVKHWSTLFSAGAGRYMVALVDCSASMAAHTAGVSSLDRAKTAARALVDRMNRGDRLTLVRAAGTPTVLFSKFGVEAENISEYIDNLETSPTRANFFKALDLASSMGRDDKRKPIVYVFTDCQASEWQELREQDLTQRLPKGAKLMIVDVGSTEAIANAAAVGAAPRFARAILGLPVILCPTVVNHSLTSLDELPLSVFVEEKEVARMLLTVNPGQTVAREVVYVPENDGDLRGRFEIGSDRFPEDDSFLFTLSVTPRITILLVRPEPGDPFDPDKNEALYLKTALSTRISDDSELAEMVPGGSLPRVLDVREIAEQELDASRLSDIDLVILADCGAIRGKHFQLLRDFVFKGGGLLIFPGQHVKADLYNDQFFAVPGHTDERLTPVHLGEIEGDPETPETFEQFAGINFGHPVMTVFDDPDIKFFGSVHVFRRFATETTKENSDSWVLARFSNGAPALVESRFGEGITVVAAYPANTRWTNLPMKPEFVPLVLRLVNHLAQRPDLLGPSDITAGTGAEITAGPSWSPAEGKVIDPAGTESPLAFQWSGSRLLGIFEGTLQKGYYTAEVSSQGDTKNALKGRVQFAVNLPNEESDFQRIGQNQLRQWLGTEALIVVDASAQMQHLKGTLGDEHEIWRPLIYLTLLIIGAEFLLSTSAWRRRTAEERLSLMEQVRRASPTTWINEMTGGRDLPE
ncbi:MAG: BatA and WFA domain-containing protein, partial [Candidatus Hydrogenedentes bacterium]|nr:BatA and WFA domain-containing protein [Candidatus Hydrogenedentota bacterium]